VGNPLVDDYVSSRLAPEQHPVVQRLRELMAECAPQAEEVLSYGSPAWRGNKTLAIISPTKTHLTFAFERGAEFDDAHGLLAGSGKKTRPVKIKNGAPLDEAALRDYIGQAVRLDAG
jgi:hypothetical protein